MIELIGVSKFYLSKKIFSKMDLKIAHGLTHIAGRNGSGKSTLLNIISGSIQPDSGDVLYLGKSLYGKNGINLKHKIGYVPDQSPIYPFLSGRNFIKFICKVKQAPWSDDLIKLFTLEKYLDTNFKDMSYGTKKKFLILAAIINKPDYLLLDEPFNGLDQVTSEHVFDLLVEHIKLNKTCVIVTHEKKWLEKLKKHQEYKVIDIGFN